MRCPNIPVVMSKKKDIAGTFRLLWVAPEDVELLGGDIPWRPEVLEGPDKELEDESGITVIYRVSSFGFSGSPGEWSMFGRATEEYHRAHNKPAQPRRDLGTGFDAKVLVGDRAVRGVETLGERGSVRVRGQDDAGQGGDQCGEGQDRRSLPDRSNNNRPVIHTESKEPNPTKYYKILQNISEKYVRPGLHNKHTGLSGIPKIETLVQNFRKAR